MYIAFATAVALAPPRLARATNVRVSMREPAPGISDAALYSALRARRVQIYGPAPLAAEDIARRWHAASRKPAGSAVLAPHERGAGMVYGAVSGMTALWLMGMAFVLRDGALGW